MANAYPTTPLLLPHWGVSTLQLRPRRSFDAVWETALPLTESQLSASVTGWIDQNCCPGCTRPALSLVTKTIIRSRLDRHLLNIDIQRLDQVATHPVQVRPQLRGAQHHETVHVRDLVTRRPHVLRELANELQASCVVGLRIVLREVSPQVAVGDRAGQSVD